MYSWPFVKRYRQAKNNIYIKLENNYRLPSFCNNKCPICFRKHRNGILSYECRKALIPLNEDKTVFVVDMEIVTKIRIKTIMKTASQFLLSNIGTVWWCVHKYENALLCPVIILNPFFFLLNNMKYKSLKDQVPIEFIGFEKEEHRLEDIKNLKRLNFQNEEISKQLLKFPDKLNAFRTAIVYVHNIYSFLARL